MSVSPEHVSTTAASPYALLRETDRAREVLALTYTASLEFFERFALADARAAGALVTVVSDATMVRADPVSVRRAGQQYLDGRAVCPGRKAFHPKLLVIVGDGQARVAIGSGNLTMAGWHGNAETWTVLRADTDGGPSTLRAVSEFLRALAEGPTTLSAGTAPAIQRVADELDQLPADAPGPRLLHSLGRTIADQLPNDAPTVDLALYAPFHDARLDGVQHFLNALQPASWTAFVQPDTVVDGPALQALATARGGLVKWVDRLPETEDGRRFRDERYWHGKLAQWTTVDGRRFALTGSPNLSTPALLQAVGDGGNCELAVLSEISHDLRPPIGEAPDGGVFSLRGPVFDDPHRDAVPVLLSAFCVAGSTHVELHAPLKADGDFERYDVDGDRWTRTAEVGRGSDRYDLADLAAPVGAAIRIRLTDGAVSNEVFVADHARLRRRQHRAVGKARMDPEEVPHSGLSGQVLADLDELRAHLLATGSIQSLASRVGRGESDETPVPEDEEVALPARPAPGASLEDFLDACDAVIGREAAQFALLLPALPGVGAALDDEAGTLDSDDDEDPQDPEQRSKEGLTAAIRRATPDDRHRYRRFVERLVARATSYPMIVRALGVRTLLHSIAARLWPDPERAADLLAEALHALGSPGDEPRLEERRAAGSLAAVGLVLLRDGVRISALDERQMRYTAAARAVGGLLADRDTGQIELLVADLPKTFAGPSDVVAAERAAQDALVPPTGVDRAVRLLAEERDVDARVRGQATVELLDAVDGLPEPQLAAALRLTGDRGPVFVRGTTIEGYPLLGAWDAPLFVVERGTKSGQTRIRLWRLAPGQTLGLFDGLAALPRAGQDVPAGGERPAEVVALLELADDDLD